MAFALLLPLLSRSSRVRLSATPETAATRLPCPWDSPGKDTGVGCHFLLQCRKVKSESEVTQSCPTLYVPMDCSPPGSSAHGIFQARTLEWGAIAFSNAWQWKGKAKSLSHVRLFTSPWTAAYQAPLPMGFSSREHWSGVPSPSPGLCTGYVQARLPRWLSGKEPSCQCRGHGSHPWVGKIPWRRKW